MAYKENALEVVRGFTEKGAGSQGRQQCLLCTQGVEVARLQNPGASYAKIFDLGRQKSIRYRGEVLIMTEELSLQLGQMPDVMAPTHYRDKSGACVPCEDTTFTWTAFWAMCLLTIVIVVFLNKYGCAPFACVGIAVARCCCAMVMR